MLVTYGNSVTGETESEVVEGVGITYLQVRTTEDQVLARWHNAHAIWIRHDGTFWTDIDFSV